MGLVEAVRIVLGDVGLCLPPVFWWLQNRLPNRAGFALTNVVLLFPAEQPQEFVLTADRPDRFVHNRYDFSVLICFRSRSNNAQDEAGNDP